MIDFRNAIVDIGGGVNECGKLLVWVYDEVKNKMLDIHMEEFEYPDIYL